MEEIGGGYFFIGKEDEIRRGVRWVKSGTQIGSVRDLYGFRPGLIWVLIDVNRAVDCCQQSC